MSASNSLFVTVLATFAGNSFPRRCSIRIESATISMTKAQCRRAVAAVRPMERKCSALPCTKPFQFLFPVFSRFRWSRAQCEYRILTPLCGTSSFTKGTDAAENSGERTRLRIPVRLLLLQCLTQIPVRALEPRSRAIATAPRQLRDKADCSLAQFFVGRLKIDHQISMHPSQPSHYACTDDIQRDFCRRPCFQARGAGNDFWAGQKIDHKVPIFWRGSRAAC